VIRFYGHAGRVRPPADSPVLLAPNWFWFEGNFASYEQNKTERLGDEAALPHRVTYRKLTR